MKKMIFALVATLALMNNALAQGQGAVNITNQTNCDIYVNAYAVCPDDCSEYSAQTMIRVSPTGPWPPFNIYTPGSASYWYPTAPSCSDWQWDYIWIDIICEGVPYKVQDILGQVPGNSSSPCNANNENTVGILIPQDCADACHGGNTNIQASWTQDANGDILIHVW